MPKLRAASLAVVATVLLRPLTLDAQIRVPPAVVETINLTGPRFGFTHLSAGAREHLAERGSDPGAFISQVGWHSEVIHTAEGADFGAVAEMVTLLGGLEQGTLIASASWVFGLRSQDGFEIGAGPSLSTAGSGWVFAIGGAATAGFVDVPIHFTVATSSAGPRVGLLTGGAIRRRDGYGRAGRAPTVRRPPVPPRRAPRSPRPFP